MRLVKVTISLLIDLQEDTERIIRADAEEINL